MSDSSEKDDFVEWMSAATGIDESELEANIDEVTEITGNNPISDTMTEENNNSEDEDGEESVEMGIDEKMAQYSNKECEYDDHIQGALNHGDSDQHPTIEALLQDVNDHGECHVTVEDHDNRLELRQGNSYFNFERGVIQIDTTKGYSHLLIPMDRVVSWEKPMSPWE